jgi:tetratricopeptide (TPR) repeat protein
MGPAAAQLQLALALLQAGAPPLPGPEPHFHQAVAMTEKSHGREHPKTGEALLNLALFLRRAQRDRDAAPILDRALSIFRRDGGANRSLLARAAYELGELSAGFGDTERALRLFQQALAAEPSAIAAARTGDILEARGQGSEAEEHYRIALTLSTGPAEEAGIANSLGLLLENQSRAADAEAMFARAATLFEKAYGQRHPEFATALTNLANTINARGEVETAAGLFARAIRIFADTVGAQHAHAQAACEALLRMRGQEATQSAVRPLCAGTSLPASGKTPIQ